MNDADRVEARAELSARNGASAMEALRRQDVIIAEQQKRIDGLNNSIATLTARLESVEQFVAVQRIKLMGAGPTVK